MKMIVVLIILMAVGIFVGAVLAICDSLDDEINIREKQDQEGDENAGQ